MADSIQFRRGLRSTVKPLPAGMPGFVEDEDRLVVGKGDGTNAELPNKTDIDNINSQMADITVNVYLLGAKCDGITDDWQVIQNYLDSNLSNYNLSFPMNKLCYISKSLVASDQHSNVHLVGQLGSVLYTDKQITLIDFQGTWNYSGISNVITNCSVENLRLEYSLTKSTNINDENSLWATGGMASNNPDDFTGNINSIGIKANSFYTNQIKNCEILGFGYGIQFNTECARNIITNNNIKDCRVAIYCAKNQVCNANIIKDNDLCGNVGLAIFIDTGAANVIKDNDIEYCRRTTAQLSNNQILLNDINGNEIYASAIYLNNCRKTTVVGNYFEGNNRWMCGLTVSQPIQLDGISKITTLNENNYYNIGDMDLTNASSQSILGNSIINFEDGVYIGEGGATNITGDNIVINPEFNFSSALTTINANKTINTSNLVNMKDYNVVYLGFPDSVPLIIANSSKFNGYKTLQFDAQGCLMTRVGLYLNIPDALLKPGIQFVLKFGMWVKSDRIGTITMYPMLLSSDSIRMNTKVCSQFNTKENEYQFVTGYLTINNTTKTLEKNPYIMFYFIAPRCLVNNVTKISDTQLLIYPNYLTSIDTGSMFKVGDTLTLSDGTFGTITQINSDNSIVINGNYSSYTPSVITHAVITSFVEGACNVSIECPQVVTKGLLQPYAPQRMKNCITKEYILDDSGTLALSRDEFNGRLSIAETITLKYTCGSTACNGTITCKQLLNGGVSTNNATITANANTSGSIILGTNQSNDYNITYTNLSTLTSKKLIIKWWIPEEV